MSPPFLCALNGPFGELTTLQAVIDVGLVVVLISVILISDVGSSGTLAGLEKLVMTGVSADVGPKETDISSSAKYMLFSPGNSKELF